MEGQKKFYVVALTLVATLGGLLFGYDTAVISGAEQAVQAYLIEPQGLSSWIHGLTTSSALIGCIIGGIVSGILASRWGRKRSLQFAAVLFFLSALGSAFPETFFFPKDDPTIGLLVMFNFYRILGGIGVGLASALGPMYIGEIAPANIRGQLVSLNQFAIIFGMLVESGSGISNTYRGKLPPFRIDYIFYSAYFEGFNYQRYKVKYSDHLPISTLLKKRH